MSLILKKLIVGFRITLFIFTFGKNVKEKCHFLEYFGKTDHHNNEFLVSFIQTFILHKSTNNIVVTLVACNLNFHVTNK